MTFSIATVPVVATLAALTALVAVLGHVLPRRRSLRVSTAVVAALLAIVTAAAGLNTYFDYVPTVGAALGRRSIDQASAVQVERAAAAPALPAHGLVEKVRIPGPVSHFTTRPAEVYLPPAWFAPVRPRLPVIELLHGTPGTPEDWTRAALADRTADRWAAAHQGWAPILVMPDINGSFTRDTECVDGPRGRAETYLTVDVPDWVVAQLGADPSRSAWVVGGASEGGYCALDLALRHPGRYATFLDFSGLARPTARGGALSLFAGSRRALQQHLPARLLRRRDRRLPVAGWFEVGAADGHTTRQVRAIAAVADRAGVEEHLVLLPHAHHTWRVWRRAFRDALPWAASRVGLTPATTS